MTKLFPILQMFLCLGASVVYLCQGDLRRAVYWFAAATITASVTF